jgi:hypothetical protein
MGARRVRDDEELDRHEGSIGETTLWAARTWGPAPNLLVTGSPEDRDVALAADRVEARSDDPPTPGIEDETDAVDTIEDHPMATPRPWRPALDGDDRTIRQLGPIREAE